MSVSERCNREYTGYRFDDYLCRMLQQVLVGLIFMAALGSLARLLLRNFRAKEGCASGCGKCDVAVRPKL